MARLTRPARGAFIAVVLALLWAAPAAAAQPTRTVTYADPFTHYPAGFVCPFAVTVYRTPGARTTVTDFSDGREALENHVIHRTITNDATGAAFEEMSISHEVDWFDIPGLIHGTISGQFILLLYPGDVGPDGVVLDHLVALYIQGTASGVLDATTYATLALAIKGTITDICAAIS